MKWLRESWEREPIGVCLCAYLIGMVLFVLVSMSIGWSQTGGKDIPECRGEECRDDVTKGLRKGQPKWCSNKPQNGYSANCGCKRECGDSSPSVDCSTACRTKSCRCSHGCITE